MTAPTPRVGQEVTITGTVRTIESLFPDGHLRVTLDYDTAASPAIDALVAERVAAALTAARDDIRSRYREFNRLGADEEYLNALNDAWGLVNNRIPATERRSTDG